MDDALPRTDSTSTCPSTRPHKTQTSLGMTNLISLTSKDRLYLDPRMITQNSYEETQFIIHNS